MVSSHKNPPRLQVAIIKLPNHHCCSLFCSFDYPESLLVTNQPNKTQIPGDVFDLPEKTAGWDWLSIDTQQTTMICGDILRFSPKITWFLVMSWDFGAKPNDFCWYLEIFGEKTHQKPNHFVAEAAILAILPLQPSGCSGTWTVPVVASTTPGAKSLGDQRAFDSLCWNKIIKLIMHTCIYSPVSHMHVICVTNKT